MIKRDGKNRGHSCLPEQSSLLCGLAISTLDAYCDSIDSGDICVKDLQLIARKRDQMEKLCSAARTGSLEKKGEEYQRIKMALDTRIREHNMFMNRRELLGNLCNGVTVPVAGEYLSLHTQLLHLKDTVALLNFVRFGGAGTRA